MVMKIMMKDCHVLITINKIIYLMESYVWITIIMKNLNVENVNLIARPVVLLLVILVMKDII